MSEPYDKEISEFANAFNKAIKNAKKPPRVIDFSGGAPTLTELHERIKEYSTRGKK